MTGPNAPAPPPAASGPADPAPKGRRSSVWFSLLLALPAVFGLIRIFAGEGSDLPDCDSASSRSMIADLYLQVPLNASQATVAELTGIAETAHDEEGGVRRCGGTIRDSEGALRAVLWSITEIEDGYEYQLELQG